MRIISVKDCDYENIVKSICNRTEDAFSEIDAVIEKICIDIRERGDKALYDYTQKYDQVFLSNLKVQRSEIEEALQFVEEAFLSIIKEAKENIWQYHQKQLQSTWLQYKEDEIILGQSITAIEKVGIYVPGGKASYPSTVLMNAIPAKVAGVKRIVMVTPPRKDGTIDPYILAAAAISGVDEIFKVGGAQSIAALAYGTESIKPVHKIVGPGNIYVARAKKRVFGAVDIDMIAGPSEICIIADENANAKYIAADLLSQAEHDEMASSVLITTSKGLAERVKNELYQQMEGLERKDIMKASIANYGAIFVVSDLEAAIALSNELAPEHLELMVNQPFEYLPKIKNAGAIFLGQYAPEPLGDYFAGPNHTLPTSGTAKFSSPLGVDDFIKKSSIIYYGRGALEKAKDKIIYFAQKEGLSAHANSIKVRFEE
ncbi:MAG: histidinol dehydrogenase [Bacillota bacterium]